MFQMFRGRSRLNIRLSKQRRDFAFPCVTLSPRCSAFDSTKRAQTYTGQSQLPSPILQHTAFSATLLLMTTITLSRLIGYIREAYIAYAFGAGQQTDAYVAAFTLPDWLNYIVAGGTASITFISIYTRFLADKREQDAQKTFSIIITVMTSVLVAGTILAEIFTPQFAGWMFHGFTPEQMRLCVHLTRILLPAQIFFYVGGVVSAVLLSHRLFLLPAFGPLIYNVFIIAGGVVAGRQMGIASLAFGALAGSIAGPFLINALGAAKIGTGYRPSFDLKNPAFREWVRLSIPLMLSVSSPFPSPFSDRPPARRRSPFSRASSEKKSSRNSPPP